MGRTRATTVMRMPSESWDEPDPALPVGGVIDQPAEPPAEGPAAIVSRLSETLLKIPGVEGLGVTEGPNGSDAIVVYVRDASVAGRVPSIVGDLPTVVEVTGPIDASAAPG